jgi:hypothetical protein
MKNFAMGTANWGLTFGEEFSQLVISHPQPLIPSIATPGRRLLLYLIPIIGFFLSLWTYHRQGSREQLAVSRLSIALVLIWLLGYLLLAAGALTSEFLTLRLLILNSFLTSSYFLVRIWLIVRVAKGKSKPLPVASRFASIVRMQITMLNLKGSKQVAVFLLVYAKKLRLIFLTILVKSLLRLSYFKKTSPDLPKNRRITAISVLANTLSGKFTTDNLRVRYYGLISLFP